MPHPIPSPGAALPSPASRSDDRAGLAVPGGWEPSVPAHRRPRSLGRLRPRRPVAAVVVAVALGALVLGLAPSAVASPPAGDLAGWAEGPVRYLLTDEEKRRWKTLREDEVERFIDLVWSRRDPDLSTPVNEMKLEFDRRVALADAHFGGESVRGSLTDRGQVLILLGEPRAVQQRIGGDQVRQFPERVVREGDEGRIFWEYDAARLPVKVPAARVLVGFYEKSRGSGEYVLDRSAPGVTLLLRALRRAPEAYVVHPDLERPVHPVSATPLPGEAAPSAPSAAPPTGAADRPAPAPVDPAAAAGGSGNAVPGPAAPRTWAWPQAGGASPPDPILAGWYLVDPPPWPEGARLLAVPGVADGEGVPPLWLQLDLPAGAPAVERLAVRWRPLAAGGAAATAGTGAFARPDEVPWTLSEVAFEKLPRNAGSAYQAALPLPPGRYALRLAAGTGPRPVAVAPATVELETIPPDGAWLSEVFAAPHVEQRPGSSLGSPFLVGGWHLVPDAEVRAGQELSYFGYVVTPPGAPAPAVSVGITLTRHENAGASPFREEPAVSAVRDGLWMYGSSLSLGGLPPGVDFRLVFRARTGDGEPERTTRVPLRALSEP